MEITESSVNRVSSADRREAIPPNDGISRRRRSGADADVPNSSKGWALQREGNEYLPARTELINSPQYEYVFPRARLLAGGAFSLNVFCAYRKARAIPLTNQRGRGIRRAARAQQLRSFFHDVT